MTEKIADRKTGVALLREVLDAYGADRTRWPAQVRRELAALISASAEAREALANAETFDRLLDQAPVLAPERVTALGERIVATSKRTLRVAASAAQASGKPAAALAWRHLAVASALAASLVIGMVAGQMQSVAPVFGDLVPGAVTAEATSQPAGPLDDGNDSADEDLI